MTQLSHEGMESVLLRLQSLQAGQGTPRQRCHASVVAADLLQARGLSWLANDLYANAARAMVRSSANEWEPDLYQRLLQQGKVEELAPRDQKE
jgi:type VI secretion system protein VasJ